MRPSKVAATAKGPEESPLPPLLTAAASVFNALVEAQKTKTEKVPELNSDIIEALTDVSKEQQGPLPPVLLSMITIAQALSSMIDSAKFKEPPPLFVTALRLIEEIRSGVKQGKVNPPLLAKAAIGSYILIDPSAASRTLIARKRKTTSICSRAPLLSSNSHLATFYLCRHCRDSLRQNDDDVEVDTPTGCYMSFHLCHFCRETSFKLRNGF